jgi:hypothetical protein
MAMPQAGPDKPWYSFDYGPIHFLQYSTEHPFHPGELYNMTGADALVAAVLQTCGIRCVCQLGGQTTETCVV